MYIQNMYGIVWICVFRRTTLSLWFHRDEQCLTKAKVRKLHFVFCVLQCMLLFDAFMHHMESSIAWCSWWNRCEISARVFSVGPTSARSKSHSDGHYRNDKVFP